MLKQLLTRSASTAEAPFLVLQSIAEYPYLEALLAASTDLKALLDREFRFIYANPAYTRAWTTSSASLAGHSMEALVGASDFAGTYKQDLEKALQGQVVQATHDQYFPKIGRRRCQTTYTPARAATGEVVGVVSVTRDIESLYRTQEALEENLRLETATFEQAAVGIAHVDLDGRWTRVNQKLCEIVGYEPEVLLGLTFQDITHPEDLEIDLALVARLLAGEIPNYELEKRYIRSDEREIWVLLTVSLLRDSEGKPLHFIAAITDIDKRKRAERQLLLREHDLSEAVGMLERKSNAQERFIHILSHDMREPVNTIANFSGLLLESELIASDSEDRRYLELIYRGSGRLKQLIADLLSYVRMEGYEAHFQQFSLNSTMLEIADDLARLLDLSHANLSWKDLPEAFGDPVLIRVLLQNLITNGIKFVPPGRLPVIVVEGTTDSAGAVVITVVDNGIGIPEDRKSKLFKPFSRLNPSSKFEGSGLGLAACLRIAEMHQGKIEIISNPGMGSRFVVKLPNDHHKEVAPIPTLAPRT